MGRRNSKWIVRVTYGITVSLGRDGENGMVLLTRLAAGIIRRRKGKPFTRKESSQTVFYNKKHFDEVLRADKTTLSTLSYDRDRTKNTDMFYATHNVLDKHQYNACLTERYHKQYTTKTETASEQGHF